MWVLRLIQNFTFSVNHADYFTIELHLWEYFAFSTHVFLAIVIPFSFAKDLQFGEKIQVSYILGDNKNFGFVLEIFSIKPNLSSAMDKNGIDSTWREV